MNFIRFLCRREAQRSVRFSFHADMKHKNFEKEYLFHAMKNKADLENERESTKIPARHCKSDNIKKISIQISWSMLN